MILLVPTKGSKFSELQRREALIDKIEDQIQAAFIKAACAVIFNHKEEARQALHDRWHLLLPCD